MALAPLSAVERVRDVLDATVWRSHSNDPQFRLTGGLPQPHEGLFLFELDLLSIAGGGGAPKLYFDFGKGFNESDCLSLARSPPSAKVYSGLVRLTRRPRQVRLDPCTAPGEFLCSDVGCTARTKDQTRSAPAPLSLPRHPSGDEEDAPAEPIANPRAATPRVGVIVHVFYPDLWPELSNYLARIDPLHHLYVSLAQDAPPDLEEGIKRQFPFALVRRVPNRGRDMLPFLQWLEVAARQGVDLICKIHTKRSPHVPNGDLWRRDMLEKLLGSEAGVREILDLFDADPGLGILGPGGHVVPSSVFWERNASRVEELCLRMGSDVRGRDFDYVAGSMFWARLQALLPLRRLALRDENFEGEVGIDDGTLAHALERCIAVAAGCAGFRLSESANEHATTIYDFAPAPPGRRSYQNWIKAFEAHPMQYPQFRHVETSWRDAPLISILMPTYETREEDLAAALESVLAQIYPRWELCIADDASSQPHVRRVLEEYSSRDSRIKVCYRARNGHISAASNSALELVTGEFTALMDHDDVLHPLALHYVAEAIVERPECELVYTDEDKLGLDGSRHDPYFKCELNYELLLAHNMVCHLGCYRTGRLRHIGGFREGFEGAQDYDLVLRFLEGVDPSRVVHVPRVLYHWRVARGSTALSGEEKPYAQLAARKAIAEHLGRVGLEAEVVAAPEAPGMNRVRFPVPKSRPQVAIVIPTRDRADLLELCVESIRSRTSYPNYSVVVVDNRSSQPATFALFERLSDAGVTILRDNSEFNFSALNNRAVRAVSSEFVCLMNNDIEVLTPDWLEEMVGMAAREGVGAVGARLWYPDRRLQHGGVIIGIGGVAGHSHKYLPRGDAGYFGRAVLHQALSAVTAACLLVRRDIYEEVGGLDESLTVAFNDIDFCLRLRAAGYRNVWTPYAEMIHHESASRGHETTPEKQERFLCEIETMQRRWGESLFADFAYSPNLTLESEDFAIAWPPRVSLAPMAARAMNREDPCLA